MPPTHPSQADVAAAYRTLIAHETEPKEQDFYRTRLQRVEQAAEPVCEFDCRSRVAAAGVGIYCPQCSAKSADTDLATELAKAIRAAWVDRLDWDELAHAALKFLTSTGRLIPAGGRALTAEQAEDVRIVTTEEVGGYTGEQFRRWHAAKDRLVESLFPATEPDEVSGNNVAECNSSTGGDVQAKKITRAWMLHLGYSEDHVDSLEQATHEGYGCEHNPFGGWDCIEESGASQHQDWDEYDNIAQIVMFVLERIPAVTSAEPIEEEAMLAARGEGWYEGYEVGLEYGPIAASGEEYEGPINPYDGPASSPVVPAPTETGPWQTWQEVPEGVWYMSRDRVMHNRYVNHSGVRRSNAGLPGLADYAGRIGGFNEAYAPFVAAEEGRA